MTSNTHQHPAVQPTKVPSQPIGVSFQQPQSTMKGDVSGGPGKPSYGK